MNTLPSWVGKIQVAWIGLGTFLTILAFQSGVQFPEWALNIFTQQTWDTILQTVTAVFTFYQYIKGIFVAAKPPAGGLSVKTLDTGSALKYALNPFKVGY